MTLFCAIAQVVLLAVYLATGFRPLLFVTLGIGLYALAHAD